VLNPSFLDIWQVQRRVCFWSLWFSQSTILSVVVSAHLLFCAYTL